ncbi:MAG: Coenzyme F420 hydrogenase/dehydrogenase, beta subunit C-terminal domain [Nostoc sp.]|uniref:Coenzyme F420 hydrogenase/dehydrogenase, beta subunit C-terminal domain n=1 Tax=Nostoc sp. TaxID=1180 RepID=UPI002FF8912E
MSFQNLQETILSPNLCASCGACQLACPSDVIQINDLYPKLTTTTDEICGECTDCLNVCPGLDTGVPESEKQLFGRLRQPEERWLGIYTSIYGGCATDSAVFERSASGGSVTTLLASAMKCLNLDCVVVAGRDDQRPWRAAPMVFYDPAELSKAAQSTYQLFPHLSILKDLFRENPSLRIGIVGIACHIQALRKLQRIDNQWGEIARKQILFTIEIACSSSTSPSGTETLIVDSMGISLDDVKEVRYREGNYPGEFVVHTKDGEKKSISLWEAVRHFKEHKTYRCLSCGDWMSGLADISVCDGDPNIFKSSQQESSHFAKHGSIFVRTETGAKVLEWARETDALNIWPTTVSGVNLGLERKRNRRAYYEGLKDLVPESPIPGYQEMIDVIPDEQLIPVLNKND